MAYRWWIHLLHRVGVVAACLGRRDLVVVHLPATRPRVRAALRVLARASRRSAHLLWMDVPADVALAGQHARGRAVRSRAFAAHVAHAEAAAVALRGGHERGWRSVRLVDRAAAERGLVLETSPLTTIPPPSGTLGRPPE